jgi:hypothetical protein
MHIESIENEVVDTQGIEKKDTADTLEDGYERYKKLGGIINEKDYQTAIDSTIETNRLDIGNSAIRSRISQAEAIARQAGIKLNNLEDVLDPRVITYVLLRSDVMPEDAKFHHSQMSDQNIFGEVLRMYDDADSLDKLIKAYPNISFDYKSEGSSALS